MPSTDAVSVAASSNRMRLVGQGGEPGACMDRYSGSIATTTRSNSGGSGIGDLSLGKIQ